MADLDSLTEKPSKSQELHRDQIGLDLEHVLRSPQGRRVLLRILERCGVYRLAFTGETEATNLRLGEQNIGLWLISQMETIGPTTYPALLMEAAQVRNKETASALVDAEE